MRARMKRRPTHPGELLREETLPAAGLTASELAADWMYRDAESMNCCESVVPLVPI
jgi:plasmid maintenance system antidote protein VapI